MARSSSAMRAQTTTRPTGAPARGARPRRPRLVRIADEDVARLRRVLAVYAAHYNGRRPHRALRLRPPRPTSPVLEPVHGRIRRRGVLGGLVNEYETAA